MTTLEVISFKDPPPSRYRLLRNTFEKEKEKHFNNPNNHDRQPFCSQKPLKIRIPDEKEENSCPKSLNSPIWSVHSTESKLNRSSSRRKANCSSKNIPIYVGKDSIYFITIDSTTTAQDVIQDLIDKNSNNLSWNNTILIEMVPDLEMFRYLRPFEPVADLLNSWDEGHKNFIKLEDIDQLRKSMYMSFPSREPCFSGRMWLLGRKKECTATLQDGTFIAFLNTSIPFHRKAFGLENKNKKREVICGLSEFDVYLPIDHKKSAKNFTFALKSQRPMSMFLDKSDYVHHFRLEKQSDVNVWIQNLYEARSWIIRSAGQEPVSTAKRKEDGPFISPQELKSVKDQITLPNKSCSKHLEQDTVLFKQGGLLSNAINQHKHPRPETNKSGQSKRTGPLLDFS